MLARHMLYPDKKQADNKKDTIFHAIPPRTDNEPAGWQVNHYSPNSVNCGEKY